MGLRVALQMDPIGSVNIDADSTFRIGLEAQARGHSLFHYTPDRLSFREGRVLARGWPVELRREYGNHVSFGPEAEVDLAGFDVVWLRQDPPFDMGYITTTHILDMIHPRTLVARDLATIRAFRATHGDVILKPLYGNGGAGVFRLDPNDRNLSSLHEMFTGISREPLIVQKYVPDVTKGDKRVILVDGVAVGAINRVPQEGETRSNLHVGGRAEPVGLTARDREICAAIGPMLRDKGQVFVGIDVIGDWLTEINVTSPTGLQELERFDGTNAAASIWEAIEARRRG